MTWGRVEGRRTDATSRTLQALTRGQQRQVEAEASPELRDLAIHHGLHLAMAREPSSELADELVPTFHSALARQTVMRNHLRRMLERFAEAGIPASPLKGPHVADLFYTDPSVRPFTDIDLLVPAERLTDALALIAADTYVASIPPKRPDADKRDIPISDPSGLGFSLDLHWDLFSYTQLRGAADGATAEAWGRATFVDDALGPRYEFPIEVTLAFLCLHALLDHRFRLILFRDLAEVSRSIDNWGPFIDYAVRWNLRSYAYVSLELARQYAGALIPDEVMDRLRPRYLLMSAATRMLDRVDIAHFDGHKPHPLNLAVVLLHDRARDRLGLVFRAPSSYPAWKRRVDAATHAEQCQVLHVLPKDLARGAQTFAKAMVDALDQPGRRHLTVMLFGEQAGVLNADMPLDLPMGRLRAAGFDPRAAWRLRHVIKSVKPQVVIAHGGEPLKYCSFAVPLGTKLVYYKIGSSEALLAHPLRRLLHIALNRRPHLVAGVSPEMVTEAEQLLRVPASRAVYIQNGRDPTPFVQSSVSGDPDGTVRFVFVGHLTRTKRPEVFARLVDDLMTAGLPVRGILVGDGPLQYRLEEVAGAHLDVMGRREDVPAILADSDVFVFPSIAEGEGMPGVVIEAGMAGLPVVGTRVPGLSTVVDDGITGLLVDPEDYDGLLEACTLLVRDPALRRSMGKRARERCISQFGMEPSIEAWSKVLAGLTTKEPIKA